MSKATLVVMAAGIGSRFGGGIKQLEPVGPNGEIIMDYSIYDAMEAGFDKVVFVIRKDLEKDFREIIGNRIEKKVEVAYAFQEVDDIPEAFKEKFAERTKPWGTGQAILCCKDVVKEPFLVINADDYYGKEAYVEAFKELTTPEKQADKMQISMVGFVLKNTLSENGGVTRGVCKVDANQMLTEIVETSNIIKTQAGAAVATDGKETPIDASLSGSLRPPSGLPPVPPSGNGRAIPHARATTTSATSTICVPKASTVCPGPASSGTAPGVRAVATEDPALQPLRRSPQSRRCTMWGTPVLPNRGPGTRCMAAPSA